MGRPSRGTHSRKKAVTANWLGFITSDKVVLKEKFSTKLANVSARKWNATLHKNYKYIDSDYKSRIRIRNRRVAETYRYGEPVATIHNN
tara:strand:- start:1615 stop:1881 length:267 start_codon:yes stop_codon:yes gene_type:complete